MSDASCGHKTELLGGEVDRCDAPAVGEFDLYLGDVVAVREHLCEHHREHLQGEFDRVVKR